MIKIYNSVQRPCMESASGYITTDSKNDATSNEISPHLSAKVLLATKAANIGIWEYVFEQDKLIADAILLSHFGITGSGYTGNYGILWGCVHPQDKKRVSKEYKKALNDQADLAI